jgi:hypothetical protein
VADIFSEMERDAVAFRRAPTPEESQSLTTLGLELVEIDQRLERYAEVAKQLMERKTDLQMRVMVDAMDAIGQDHVGLADQGCDLVLSDYYKAGLPNPDTVRTDEEKAEYARLREEGIALLTEDAPDILTTTVTVTLPKGSLERAQEIVGLLTSEQGFGLEPARVKLEEGVHWGTLTSYVKEQVRERRRSDLPLKALGATVGRIVKIVKRKKK